MSAGTGSLHTAMHGCWPASRVCLKFSPSVPIREPPLRRQTMARIAIILAIAFAVASSALPNFSISTLNVNAVSQLQEIE